MKTVIVCCTIAIFYAIVQEQLPCNFSVTCLAGMPTIHQSLVDPWTGKVRPRVIKPVRLCEGMLPPFDCATLDRKREQSKKGGKP
jgi:hypothetical protein